MIANAIIYTQLHAETLSKLENVDNYPIKIDLVSRSEEVAQTRAYTQGQLQEVLATNTLILVKDPSSMTQHISGTRLQLKSSNVKP